MGPPPLGLRKNKLQPSCDFCRKSKLRCDHVQPCARCVKRGRGCVYSEAPMTKIPEHARASRSPAVPLSTPTQASSSTPTADAADPLAIPSRGSYHARDDLDLGYMGSISHSADLHNNQIGASLADLQTGLEPLPPDEASLSESQLRIQRLCIAILECLPSARAAQRVIVRVGGDTSHACDLGPTLDAFYSRFWESHALVFERPRSHDRLRGLSNLLCENTSRPLVIPRTNAEWLDSVCNYNSRWELVGLAIVSISVIAWNKSDTDPTLLEVMKGVANNRRDYCCQLLDCADACYRLCTTELKQNNRLTVLLFMSSTWLQSIVGGDSSFALWVRKGAAVAAMTAFGMQEYHEEEEALLPRAHAQDIRLLVGTAIILDTGLATFTGRPPTFSCRYLSCPLPWDIPSQDAVDDTRPIDVDENGWNRSGKILPVTRVRCSVLNSQIRQEILELSLGRPHGANLQDIIEDIRQRLDAMYRTFPAIFHTELDRTAYDRHRTIEVAAIYGERLHYLHSRFLLARIEHSRNIQNRFFEAAQQMLSLTNAFFNIRDRLIGHTDELVWHICCFGIPAASAISVELWKTKANPSIRHVGVTRSQMILELSVFLSALDWVAPVYGNYTLCNRAYKMIKHILDHVLAPAPEGLHASNTTADPFDIGGMSLDAMPTFGAEFESFFEGIDWDAISWEPPVEPYYDSRQQG